MTSLITVKRCIKETGIDRAMNREYLDSLVTSDEHGRYISHSVATIINNRATIMEQKSLPEPDAKKIAKAQEHVETCIDLIKIRLARLGATADEITAIVAGLNSADYQCVTLQVLKLMARKNPGMNQRKYNQALKIIASKNNQKQH